MTKLTEWIFGLSIFAASYIAIIKGNVLEGYVYQIFQFLPLILIFILGVS